MTTGENEKNRRCFSCGLLAGGLQAGIFNPWDRALYLAHINKRPFLSIRNFYRPYEGFHQSIIHRIVTGGLYFPLEDVVKTQFPERHGPALHTFTCGLIAGSTIAIMTNPLAAVKYQSWGAHQQGEMIKTAIDMATRGGFHTFFRGIHTTVLRDMIWGGTYAFLRNYLPFLPFWGKLGAHVDLKNPQNPGIVSFSSNLIAASVGTMLSAPLNYVRNVQIGRDVAKQSHTMFGVLKLLVEDANTHHEPDRMFPKLQYLLRRLAIGWGTLRVGLGLAFSSQVYGYCLNYVYM